MKSVAIVCPYYGPVPSLYPFWVKTVGFNSTIDFFLITDNPDFGKIEDLPPNLKIVSMPIREIKQRAANYFGFEPRLDRPYKLCDYKPTYGLLFSDLLHSYDFWGYCDMGDELLGNIRKFITDELMENYDKIQDLGHLTLFKNDVHVNRRFMMPSEGRFIGYPETFQTDLITVFDEEGVKRLWEIEGFSHFASDEIFVDVGHFSSLFRAARGPLVHKKLYFEISPNGVFAMYKSKNKVERFELAYIHFQKRKIYIKASTKGERWFLTPNALLDTEKRNMFGKANILYWARTKAVALIGRISRHRKYQRFRKTLKKTIARL